MYKHFFKRLIDFCVALIVLVCISPLLLVVTLWLHSGEEWKDIQGYQI